MKKKNSVLKSLVFLLVTLLILLAISYIGVYIFWTMFTTKVYFWNVDLLNSKKFHIVVFLFNIVFDIITVVTLLKYNLISFTKIVNKVERAESDAFGSSRWQTKSEISANYGHIAFDTLNEVPAEGYVTGAYFEHKKLYLNMVKEQHCCTVGTSGTGKSYYFLSPTIQANAFSKTKSSMVINDLKGELYGENSKLLKEQGYDVIKLDLRNPHISDRYNPLSLIYDLYHKYLSNKDGAYLDRVSVYINEIAACLCPIGQGDQQQWSQGAQSIIKSIIWGLLEDSAHPSYKITREMFTILQLSNIINRQKAHLNSFLANRPRTSPVFDYAGMILDNPSPKTVGSYFATLSTALEAFLEPGLQKITSATDIDITKLATNPTAIFIIIPDELKSRNIVGTMIISQLYNYLTFEASQKTKERLDKNVYFFLDEFGNLPQIQNFPSWISLGRSRGIFFDVIVQADSQLNDIYGTNGAKTILQNCHLQILLGASEIETLKRFGDLLGKYTIYSRSANIDQANASLEYKGSTSLTSKDLVTLDQLQRMQKGDIYYKILGAFPVKAKLIPLFDERVQNLYVRGAALEKGTGRHLIELDKERLFYDLELRENIYMEEAGYTSRSGFGDSSLIGAVPGVIKNASSNFIIIENIDVDFYNAYLKDAGFVSQNGSYDESRQTISIIVPEARKKELADIFKSHNFSLKRESNIERNANLFSEKIR